MTDNEIIKALEYCHDANSKTCGLCVFYNNGYGCTAKRFCLDLINRQKAEIENYSNNTKTMSDSIYKMQKLIESQKAEIERLQSINDSFTDIGKLYSEIKAEAIKEFAERLKERLGNTDLAIRFIDNLVKEMVGDEDGRT